MNDDRAKELKLGEWQVLRAGGELQGPAGATRLEPKVVDLLFLLASRPNEVFSREEIQQELWPDVVVGEDALARLVFKLRRALGDDPKAPRFLETLPKRGYRLRREVEEAPVAEPTAEPAAVSAEGAEEAAPPVSRARLRFLAILAAALLVAALAVFFVFRPGPPSPPTIPAATAIAERANDFYFQYSREDNEAAIELFERLVGAYPDYAPAYAGLANALVQRVMRWPSEPGVEHKSLRSALASGDLSLPRAQRTLERAGALARQAVALAPQDAASYKALGLVRSAGEDFEGALAAYKKAVELDANAWGAMINIADVLEIEGKEDEALPHFEKAFAAMTRVYQQQTPRVQPWYAETATAIGDRHRAKKRLGEAEAWYRRALEFTPLHPAATRGLARVLAEAGDLEGASRLCRELQDRLGVQEPCLEAEPR